MCRSRAVTKASWRMVESTQVWAAIGEAAVVGGCGEKAKARPRSDLVHVGVTHRCCLYGRRVSPVLLDLSRERHAGASRTNHRKYKYRFPHEAYYLNRRAHPAASFLEINHNLVRFN
jgi:hypothetical protein